MTSRLDRLEEEFHRLTALPEAAWDAELAALALSGESWLTDELRPLLVAARLTATPLDGAALQLADGITLVDDLRDFALGNGDRQAGGPVPPGGSAGLPLVPGYRILDRLGRGGSGTVYLAEQVRPEFSRMVALKIVDRAGDAESARRVEDERRILAQLEHPGIARLYDAGLTPSGQPFLAMERVDGLPISEHCELLELTVEARLTLFLSVLEAVEYAHRSGVVHRDLKPGNILVSADGATKLLDFGIARVVAAEGEEQETRTLNRAMTPAYASPEQVLGQRVTAASDIYSLGVVLYELLAGTSPYRVDGTRFATYEEAVRAQDPEPPSTAVTRSTRVPEGEDARPERERRRRALRGDIDAVVLRALRKEPAARYGSVREFAHDLRQVLAGQPVEARTANRRYRWLRRLRRHRRGVAAAIAVAIALGLLALPATRARLLTAIALEVEDGLDVYATAGRGVRGSESLVRGAEALRRWDPIAARASFAEAVSSLKGQPLEALAWDGRARAGELLGEADAAVEAARAAALAPALASLPKVEQERLRLRGLAAQSSWEDAVGGLDRLFGRFPDRVDIGFDLFGALLRSGQTEAAEATLDRIGQIPALARDPRRDPRLDLGEAEVAFRLGEHQRSAAAAIRGREWAAKHGSPAIALRARRLHAEALSRLDLREEASLELEAILPQLRAAGLPNQAALAALALGRIVARTSDDGGAVAVLAPALAELERLGDRRGQISALTAMAFLAAKTGELERGLALTERAVALAQAAGDGWCEGEVLVARLALSNWAGDARAVSESRDPALRALRRSANREELFATLNNLALDAIEHLDLDRAQSYLDEAAGLARRRGSRSARAGIDRALGYLEEARGAFDAARQHYESALELARLAEAPLAVATYLADLAWLEVAADRPGAAASRADEAIAAHLEIGKQADAAELEGVLAWVGAREGDRSRSLRHLEAMRQMVGRTPSLLAWSLEARTAEAAGDYSRAVELRERAVRRAEEDGLDLPRLEQRLGLARALFGAGRRDEARRLATVLLAEAEARGLFGTVTTLRQLFLVDPQP